jgi:hypothetical protein
MQREEVHTGLLVRLLSAYSNVPAGTFTVRWHPYKPIPAKFPREVMEYSLNLWESDLALFEVLTIEDKQGGQEASPKLPRFFKATSATTLPAI